MSRDTNSLNKVILIGNVGRAPETRYIPQKETKVVNFSLATNERSFNPNTRETRDFTEWHRIVVWNKLADFAEKYVTQGKQLLVEGKLRTRKWQDRSGNQRSTTEIEALNIILLGRRPDAPAEDAPYGGGDAPAPDYPSPADDESQTGAGAGTGAGGDDEIPF
jgi:single-strand DNA-binding protein